MRYYLDTEFNERGHEHPIELISVGIVAEDNRTLHAFLSDGWKIENTSDWVKENVLTHLTGEPQVTRAQAREAIERLVQDDPKPEFWGYFADYDWVLFCQLFGRMIDLPPSYPYYCRDVKQLASDLGYPGDIKAFQRNAKAHSAIDDAWQIRWMHEGLMSWRATAGRS